MPFPATGRALSLRPETVVGVQDAPLRVGRGVSSPVGQVEGVQVAALRADLGYSVGHRRGGGDEAPVVPPRLVDFASAMPRAVADEDLARSVRSAGGTDLALG